MDSRTPEEQKRDNAELLGQLQSLLAPETYRTLVKLVAGRDDDWTLHLRRGLGKKMFEEISDALMILRLS